MQLLLIRHGQSANNALDESLRVPDPGLTEVGSRQAEVLANWLATYPPTDLYCSGFLRSLLTTQPVAGSLAMTPKVQADLYEVGGCYQGYHAGNIKPATGMGYSQIQSLFPGWEVDSRIDERGWYHGKEIEDETAARNRADRIVDWFESELKPKSPRLNGIQRPALIIHADLKQYLMEAILGRQISRTHQPILISEAWNTSVSQFSYENGQWRLDYWNSIGHLPMDLRTS